MEITCSSKDVVHTTYFSIQLKQGQKEKKKCSISHSEELTRDWPKLYVHRFKVSKHHLRDTYYSYATYKLGMGIFRGALIPNSEPTKSSIR
jgi:hypothetical protein